MHAALLQEPWCFTVEQVKRLTTWQAYHLFVMPAVERAKELKKQTQPEGEKDMAEIELEPREDFIASQLELYPDKPREYFEKVYDLLQERERS